MTGPPLSPPPAEATVGLLRELSTKTGLSLRGLREDELNAVLYACRHYCAEREMPATEKQLTVLLKEWLDKTTGLIRTDAAELRRTLVDLDFIRRDRAGKAYTASSSLPSPTVGEESAEPDYTEIIVTTRAEERTARERRKRLRSGS